MKNGLPSVSRRNACASPIAVVVEVVPGRRRDQLDQLVVFEARERDPRDVRLRGADRRAAC